MTALTMHAVTRRLQDSVAHIEFDADKHRYFCNGKRIPGVTTILGVLAKPALIGWAARMAVEHVAGNEDRLATELELVLDEAKGAHRQIAKEGADLGTLAHEAINVWCAGEVWDTYLPEDPQARNSTLAMLKWMEHAGVEVLASEVIVAPADPASWAGTVDLVGHVDGKLLVADMKSNRSGVYAEHLLQGAAYAACVERALEIPIDETIVVHACRETGIPSIVSRTREQWLRDAEIFQACLASYTALKELNKAVKQPVVINDAEAVA